MPRFEENIAAAVEAVGKDKVGLVWGLGLTDWESAEQRDNFLRAITEER